LIGDDTGIRQIAREPGHPQPFDCAGTGNEPYPEVGRPKIDGDFHTGWSGQGSVRHRMPPRFFVLTGLSRHLFF